MSLVDLDGYISCIIFLGGCNFRCPFCQNGDLVVNPNLIEGLDENEILSYLEKRKGVLEAVCISGGEPTLTNDLEDLARKIKNMGYYVKMDSNGTNPDVLKSLYQKGLVDYFAMDIKNSEKKYNETTAVNVNMERIKESINFLMTSGVDYEFRTTLIDEFHTEEDIKEIGKLVKGAKRFFLQHFVLCDSCLSQNLHDVKLEKAQRFKEILKETIDQVNLRGYDE